MSIVLYEENGIKKESNNEEEYYFKIKSYIALLRSQNYEEKEIAQKFFENNKKNNKLYEVLNKIAKNLNETNDVRIHTMQILRKFYLLQPEYLKYKADEENLLEIGIEPELHNALPSSEVSQRNNSPLSIRISNGYNSLSYIDPLNDNFLKQEMEQLIQEEMKNLKPKDYLNELPVPNNNPFSDLVNQEMERVEKKQKINVNFKINNKFEIPPPSKYYDVSHWESLLNQVNISQQHLELKSLNLELLIKYGPNSWRKYLTRFENVVKQLEIEKVNLEIDNEEINKRRKFIQLEAQKEFTELENKYKYHLSQVNALRKESLRLNFRIKRLHIAKKQKIERKKKKQPSK